MSISPKGTNGPMPVRLVLSGIGAAILLAATVLTGLYLGLETRDRFDSIDGSWRTYSAEADRRGELLSRIRGLLGYGGIIHNFKNFVLRQDDVYLRRMRGQRFVRGASAVFSGLFVFGGRPAITLSQSIPLSANC